jgi:hypothetical protein
MPPATASLGLSTGKSACVQRTDVEEREDEALVSKEEPPYLRNERTAAIEVVYRPSISGHAECWLKICLECSRAYKGAEAKTGIITCLQSIFITFASRTRQIEA